MPRKPLWLPIAAVLGGLLGSACGPPAVGLRLRFPSLETFLVSSTARVEVYDGRVDPDAICRSLSVGQTAGLDALQSSGKRDVCELQAGLAFKPVDTGRLVVFADVQDRADTGLLRGCKVVDVDGKPGELADDDRADAEQLDVVSFIEVQLATLPTYPARPDPACASIDDKCTRRVACTP